MSQEQLAEAEAARQQARLSAEKFQRIYQATEPKRLPQTPKGKPPEAIKHRVFEAGQLRQPKQKPPRIVRIREKSSRRRRGRRPRIFFPLTSRQQFTAARLREGSPANISRAEKDKALRRLDAAIADWSRRYTFRVVHGGTPQEKNEAAVHLRQLSAEKEAIEAMRPLGVPEHIRRAEAIES